MSEKLGWWYGGLPDCHQNIKENMQKARQHCKECVYFYLVMEIKKF